MTGIRHIAVVAASGLMLGLGIVGCESQERPEAISPNATKVLEGNKTLSFEAPSDGRVTLYDGDTNHIVYSSEMTKGQSLMADVDNNRITLNGQTAVQNNLHKGDEYRVFFEPSTVTDKTSRIQTDTVETTHDR